MRRVGTGKFGRRTKGLVLASGLIAASTIAAWFLIQSSRSTESFLITQADVASGTALANVPTSAKQVALFELGEEYLSAGEDLSGSYLSRALGAGELIPRSAIVASEQSDFTNVVITPTIAFSSQISPGRLISLWSLPKLDYDNFGEATLLAISAEVVAITQEQGAFAGQSPQVEIRLPQQNLTYLLHSIANGDALAITPSSSIGQF